MQKELKIDMDWKPPKDYLSYWKGMAISVLWAWNLHGWRICKFEESCSKEGYHIRIMLKDEIEDEDALKLQFVLGDDRVRCKLNYERMKAGIKDWNKLFIRKIKRK